MQTPTGTGLDRKRSLEISRRLQTHPFVESLKPEPDQPAKQVAVLAGLPGKSDRDGYQRFYLNTKLDYYAECRTEAIVYLESVPPDQSPFPGMEATRASILCDATIYYISARTPQPVDRLDFAVRTEVGSVLDSGPPLPLLTPPTLTPYSLTVSALGAFRNGLGPGDTLWPDQWIISPNKRYLFWYQSDGNLVLYDMSVWPWDPRWASGTKDSGVGGRCTMQTDGNLVLYAPGLSQPWNSVTEGNNGSWLAVQDDGKAVIYSSSGSNIWGRPE